MASEMTVKLGVSNEIIETRTPVYLEYNGRNYHALIIQNANDLKLECSKGMPMKIRKKVLAVSGTIIKLYLEHKEQYAVHAQKN